MTWVLVWLIYASVIIAFVLMVWRMTKEGKNMNYGPYDGWQSIHYHYGKVKPKTKIDERSRKALAETLRNEPENFVIGLSFMALIEAITHDYNLNSRDAILHLADFIDPEGGTK